MQKPLAQLVAVRRGFETAFESLPLIRMVALGGRLALLLGKGQRKGKEEVQS